MAIKQTSLFNFDEPPAPKDQLKEFPIAEPVAEMETIVEQEPVIVPDEVVNKPSERKSPRGRMKLSNMNTGSDDLAIPEDEILFEKRYYNIGVVAGMFKVNQSLIRYWENEFDILKPMKNGKGDRLFRPEDIKGLKLIYQLLREKKYTIEGAKEFLKKNKKAKEKFAMVESLQKLKLFLTELKASL